ncbi:type IX secretion system periplasmic lipoprotein PorW/SprE [Mangrovivirga cuniculi]|nr:tetratricopeptide repeat protein [Mangrovivirga cuniculi]
MQFIKNLLFLFLLLTSFSCAVNKSNPVSMVWHDTNAKYNAYWLARENLKAIEEDRRAQYEDNFEKVLYIYPPLDTAQTNAYDDQLEDVIKKASMSIQRHEGSNWNDNAYVAVGDARYYRGELEEAVNTYKYVNVKGEDDNTRHEALIGLIYTFIFRGERNNIISVIDYLAKEELNKNNQKEFYLAKAYFYQLENDSEKVINNLEAAVELESNHKKRARYYFILGQVYQELGFDALAYQNYNKCVKNNPNYELFFYSRLNMAQVYDLAKESDTKKIKKYFEKLLKDRKNKEYKDKIYHEMGAFAYKLDEEDQAIEYFKKSVKQEGARPVIKAASFRRLAEIYYNDRRNYRLAKNYYDSTVQFYPQDEPDYEELKKRQQILETFVGHLETVETNDSLLNLASMDSLSVSKIIDEQIDIRRQEIEEEEEKKKEEEKRREQALANAGKNTFNSFNNDQERASPGWYFDEPSAISRGINEFEAIWGDRELEDNWRRSNKIRLAGDAPVPTVDDVDDVANVREEEVLEESPFENDPLMQPETYWANIPSTDEEKQELTKEVENSLFQVGKIYHFDLKEDEYSFETLNEFISRFSEAETIPEALFLLKVIAEALGEDPSKYERMLLNEHPNSLYAKILENPDYLKESEQAARELRAIYKNAYSFYENGEYKKADSLISASIRSIQPNEFTDNAIFLQILIKGKTEPLAGYQYGLQSFIKNYPDSDLIPFAEKLLEEAREEQKKYENLSEVRYEMNRSEEHYWVMAVPTGGNYINETSKAVKDELDKLNQANLNYNLLSLNDDFALVMIQNIPDYEGAMTIFNNFLPIVEEDLAYGNSEFFNFVISKSNFDTFYKRKDLTGYNSYFKKQYLNSNEQ